MRVLTISGQFFIICRHGESVEAGSLIHATNLWVRQSDMRARHRPAAFSCTTFEIPNTRISPRDPSRPPARRLSIVLSWQLRAFDCGTDDFATEKFAGGAFGQLVEDPYVAGILVGGHTLSDELA